MLSAAGPKPCKERIMLAESGGAVTLHEVAAGSAGAAAAWQLASNTVACSGKVYMLAAARVKMLSVQVLL